MIRTVADRLLWHPAAPPLPSSARALLGCNTCSTLRLLPIRGLPSVSCSCQPALEVYNAAPDSQSVFKAPDYVDQLEDWEFAGEEERDDEENMEACSETASHLLSVITAPNTSPLSEPPASSTLQYSEANSPLEVESEADREFHHREIGQYSTECDWLEPPGAHVQSSQGGGLTQMGDECIMLEAFHQFQQNPQVQKMVVALATDEGVWRAVLGSEKLIQEYRRGCPDGDFEAGVVLCKEEDRESSSKAQNRAITRFLQCSHNVVSEMKNRLRDRSRGLVEIANRKVFAETRHMMLDLMLRSCMMLAVMILTLTLFLSLLPLQVI